MSHRVELRSRPDEHFVYSGRSVLITNLEGCVSGDGLQGFYFANTRVLSLLEVVVAGERIRSFAASPVGADGFLAYAAVPESDVAPKHAVFVEIAHAVADGLRTHIRLVSRAWDRDAVCLTLALRFEADFADQEEAHRGQRKQTAPVVRELDETRSEMVFVYRHPDLDRRLALRVESAPSGLHFDDEGLTGTLELRPHEPIELSFVAEPVFDGKRYAAPGTLTARTPIRDIRQQLEGETPRLTTTNATVANAWQTATQDLASLALGLPDGPATPIAGLPLYQQFFGRDSLTIAWQALMAMPTMMRDTLRMNAAWQGSVVDDWLDEEPGKLIHQARWGPLSALGLDPFSRYYGDYATVPDFLIMLGQYLAWTGDVRTVRSLLPAARRALEWLDRYADSDGDGFIEYRTRSRGGVKHQGWKDSDDAIVDEDGAVVEPPIATSELQAYWYAALGQAAFCFLVCGDVGYAAELRMKADALKRRFDAAYWMPDRGFYAMALGPDGRQVRSISSNTGHLLAAGIVPRAKARVVARRLLEPDLFTGWGVRTLSSEHIAFNPFSYHRGSVWPVENGTFAFGLARYGCWAELDRLARAVFDSTELFVSSRLPEVIGGVQRDELHPHPGIYPESHEPQGWSASMVVMLVQAILGLYPLAPARLLTCDPHLPSWLPDVRLETVRVGDAIVDLTFERRRDGTTSVRVTRRDGRLSVIRQPVPDGPEATLPRRAMDLARSLPRLRESTLPRCAR